MRLGWGALIAFVMVGLLAAEARAPAPSSSAAPTAMVGAAAQSTLTEPARGRAPLDDGDTRDVDNDDDSDDDASLTAAVAMELPQQRRFAYRATASAFRAPPDAQELLRPPQLGVD